MHISGVFGFVFWMFVETWAVVVTLILMIPLVAMQFTKEVNWDLFDFAFMGILLFGAGLTYDLVTKRMGTGAYRVAVGVAVVTAVLLVWINGAVGIIGDGPVNLMYFGVLAVGFLGAIIARFEPRNVPRALCDGDSSGSGSRDSTDYLEISD